jgi:hypothetical protein
LHAHGGQRSILGGAVHAHAAASKEAAAIGKAGNLTALITQEANRAKIDPIRASWRG